MKSVLLGVAFGLGLATSATADSTNVSTQGFNCEVTMPLGFTATRVMSIIDTFDLEDGPMEGRMNGSSIGGLPGGDRFIAIMQKEGPIVAKCTKGN